MIKPAHLWNYNGMSLFSNNYSPQEG